MTKRKFPSGFVRTEDGAIYIDPEIVYPAILDLLRVKKEDIDQYWVECAYQCAKMAAQDLVRDTEYDPAPAALRVFIVSRKDTWANKRFKQGRGSAAATYGREARVHYQRIRSAMLGF